MALDLLRREFPELEFSTLPGYNINYNRKSMVLNMAIQGPKLFKAIRNEKRVLAAIVDIHNPNLIISDNRFGCHHPKVHSIIMTHQLSLKSPIQWASKLATFLNYRMLDKFNEIWVPDHKDEKMSLAGELSHPKRMPKTQLEYIGPLTRFAKQDILPKNDILFVISGPEPQRTKFEQLCIEVANTLPQEQCTLVRGSRKMGGDINSNIKVIDIATSKQLQELVNHSKIVVCRSGYSSIMDLAELEKLTILIPTPNQPEQEYLAEFHKGKSIFKVIPNDAKDLKREIETYI